MKISLFLILLISSFSINIYENEKNIDIELSSSISLL